MSRLFVSAAHKSSGKTTLSIGIAAALAGEGLHVQCFKKGPDYIDPMWHARASGRPCYNLDFNTQDSSEILDLAARKSAGAHFTLIEGNKGLHDGVDPEGSDSSAALAKLLQAPVVLVVDVLGMTRGIAPLLIGYQAFDRDVNIAGVILNRVGTARQEGKLRAAIERYCDMPVLGAVGRNGALEVAERHLGLTTPAEDDTCAAKISAAAAAVRNGVDLRRLQEIACKAGAASLPRLPEPPLLPQSFTLAVARDEAFGFYYPDDLEALQRNGARLVFFDVLRDAHLPDADALFVGGGFPEMHAQRLAANAPLRADIARRITAGIPAYAECGGLMYLGESIEIHGERHAMVGAIPGRSVFHSRPQGRGLVRLVPAAGHPWALAAGGAPIRAHEFHYASFEPRAAGLQFAYEVARGHGVDGSRDGIRVHNLLANFSHLRDTAQCNWTAAFAGFVRSILAGKAA
ncbi:MAG: cobyrinate a,c-diamide synthase [Beijerinckiaceae bacterium]